MKLIANVLLKILILCILPMLATINDIDSWQDKIEDFILNETFSDLAEDDEQNNNGSESRDFSHTNTSEGYVGDLVDLEDDCNQTVEHTFDMPEIKTEKRKHSSELIHGNTQNQPPVKCRKRKQDIQMNYSEEDLFSHIAEFDHRSSSHFLFSKKDFKIDKYRSILKANRSVFIEEFCSKTQLQDIHPDIFARSDGMTAENFKHLEIFTKRIVTEYVEIVKHKNEDPSKFDKNSYASINKTLDPARTKGFYYLLIYSFYETGLVGVPRCMDAVEKIFINIITHTRLMAYMHNGKVKEEIQSKKLYFSQKLPSTMSRSEQSKNSATNFSYTDFTKALFGQYFKKYDVFHKNADLMRKEIINNIQLIINEEFRYNSKHRNLCEDYNSQALEFNRSILFERFSFQIGKNVGFKYTDGVTAGFDFFVYNFGYPKNILACLMDTETKNQIKEFADIKLKSVFILIFISKLCLCSVTDLCTLPEYLILIGSLQEAYNKHKAGQDKTIANFQSLTSYFFSLHYLDKDQEEDRREEAKSIIENIFPECNEIFPNFDSKIDDLRSM